MNDEITMGLMSVNDGLTHAAKRPEIFDNVPIQAKSVTRITVVGDEGIVFERYNLYENGVDLVFQDQGRTLKIFPRGVVSDARSY